jgi:phosphoglycerate dehydrogenase-like enzyme
VVCRSNTDKETKLGHYHPFRTLDNVLATPHIGYVSHGLYNTFYEDIVSNIRNWLDTH